MHDRGTRWTRIVVKYGQVSEERQFSEAPLTHSSTHSPTLVLFQPPHIDLTVSLSFELSNGIPARLTPLEVVGSPFGI